MDDPPGGRRDSAAARFLAKFTEQTAIRWLARGFPGELLLADHDGDIVDPTLDPRVFTTVPADRAPERYAFATLLMGGDSYLPGCLVLAAALRWHVSTRATLVCRARTRGLLRAWCCAPGRDVRREQKYARSCADCGASCLGLVTLLPTG